MRCNQFSKQECASHARRFVKAVAVAACAGLLGAPGAVLGTASSGFMSSTVGPTTFGELDVKLHADRLKVKLQTHGFADVYVVSNTVVVGGHSGWHTHPGPSLVTVKSGVATYYDGHDPSCTPHVVQAGEGFIDAGDGHVHMVRNEGSGVLELVAFQILPLGAPRRIDVPSPGTCPF